MDFYIMFYHDARLRTLFIKGSEPALEIESWEVTIPSWLEKEFQRMGAVPGEDVEDVPVEQTDGEAEDVQTTHGGDGQD